MRNKVDDETESRCRGEGGKELSQDGLVVEVDGSLV